MRPIRQINQPVQMTTAPDGQGGQQPASFSWRGSRYQVMEVLDSWSEIGRWWEREAPCTVWRVHLRDGGMMELACLDGRPPEWRLLVVYD